MSSDGGGGGDHETEQCFSKKSSRVELKQKCPLEDKRNEHKEDNHRISDSDSDVESYTESEKINHLKQWEMSNTEYLLKGWGEKAGCLRWMHLKSAIYWRSVDHTLNVTGILMSSLVSASSLLGTANSVVSQDTLMSIVGVISMCNVINQSLQTFYDCKNKAAKHDIAARQFGNFYRYVSTKLSMSRLERGDPKLILDYAVRENERLYRDNPDPHYSSVTLFKRKFTDNFQSKYFEIPDIVTDTFAICVFESNPLYETFNLKNDVNPSVQRKSLDKLSRLISTKRRTLNRVLNRTNSLNSSATRPIGEGDEEDMSVKIKKKKNSGSSLDPSSVNFPLSSSHTSNVKFSEKLPNYQPVIESGLRQHYTSSLYNIV